jgi:hypothetical protein
MSPSGALGLSRRVAIRCSADCGYLTCRERVVELAPAGLAVLAAISFAALAEPLLVEARCPQFLTDIPSGALAGLAVSAAIALAALAEPLLLLARKSQFLAIPGRHPDDVRPDVEDTRERRSRKEKKGGGGHCKFGV